MYGRRLVGALAVAAMLSIRLEAQSTTDLAALAGLAPVTTLSRTSAGRAALGANYTVTGGIQAGELRQSALLPFADDQQQALRDVFESFGNLAQLADGLGTTLGAAYVTRAHYIDRTHFTELSRSVSDVAAYALAVAHGNSTAGKYFFANFTTDGRKPVSAEAKAIVEKIDGTVDMFGRAYGFPAGGPGAGSYGDARPFQTEPNFTRIIGRDYFGTPADNTVYNRGPMMNLTNSPSFPSGHTTYGYTGVLVLAFLFPERYPEMIVRGAEYGNHRIVVGAHYAMDVLGGRTLALYDMAHLLANDSAYVGQSYAGVQTIKDFRGAVVRARKDARKILETVCGKAIAECAREDIGRLSDPAANSAFYASTQTYGLPVVYAANSTRIVDVGKVAPEAGYLLTIAYPSLSLQQANDILSKTLGPGGGFLDDGSEFGVYSRIDLHAAARYAAVLTAGK